MIEGRKSTSSYWMHEGTTLTIPHLKPSMRKPFWSPPAYSFQLACSLKNPSLKLTNKLKSGKFILKKNEGDEVIYLRPRETWSSHWASSKRTGPPQNAWRVSKMTSLFQDLSSNGISKTLTKNASFTRRIVGHTVAETNKKLHQLSRKHKPTTKIILATHLTYSKPPKNSQKKTLCYPTHRDSIPNWPPTQRKT